MKCFGLMEGFGALIFCMLTTDHHWRAGDLIFMASSLAKFSSHSAVTCNYVDPLPTQLNDKAFCQQ